MPGSFESQSKNCFFLERIFDDARPSQWRETSLANDHNVDVKTAASIIDGDAKLTACHERQVTTCR
jgi:hypothetical protein